MLSLQAFTEAIEIVMKAHPTNNMKHRVEALHYFFHKEELETVEKAAQELAHDADKFPTPKVFGIAVRTNRPDRTAANRVDCDFCDGAGIISAVHREKGGDFCFRCHCANAAQYPSIPPWTTAHRETFELPKNTYQAIYENPAKYKKGLAFALKHGVPKNVTDKMAAIIEAAEKRKDFVPF